MDGAVPLWANGVPVKCCKWCANPIPQKTYYRTQYLQLEFCGVSHAHAYRTAQVKQQPPPRNGLPKPNRLRRELDLVPLPPARFSVGVERTCTRCPKCEGLLATEPGIRRCRLCGKLWPVRDALIESQFLFEAHSGFLDPMPRWR